MESGFERSRFFYAVNTSDIQYWFKSFHSLYCRFSVCIRLICDNLIEYEMVHLLQLNQVLYRDSKNSRKEKIYEKRDTLINDPIAGS